MKKIDQLDTRELSWLFDFAHEKCCETITECRQELMLLERFDGPRRWPTIAEETRDRERALRNIQDRLQTYYKIEETLVALRLAIAEKSAEEFADQFRDYLVGKKK